jgi:hypothetical protein
MKILEATCGARSYWRDKQHPETVFVDLRVESDPEFSFAEYDIDGAIRRKPGSYSILPDIQADYRQLPFDDRSFDLVVFDPPHMVTNSGMKNLSGIMKRKYGSLRAETWQRDLNAAFCELFRVMTDFATLTFKFWDGDIGFDQVLEQIPAEPLYGTTSKSGTHETRWLTFNKPERLRQSKEPGRVRHQ